MKNFAGLDLSFSSTGLVVLDETGKIVVKETIKTDTSMTHRARLVLIGDTICQMLVAHFPVAIAKESPAYAAKFGVHLAGEVHGSVDASMERAGLAVPYAVAPATLKKMASGRGVGTKGEIQMWVLDRWGERITSNDMCDAYILARIAGMIAGAFPVKSRHEGECLKTILSGMGMEVEAKAIKLLKNDVRVCSCGKRMKTGIEMESGTCARCLRGETSSGVNL